MSLAEIVLIFVAFVHVKNASSKSPHIVILMADDMGWDDIGCHGSEVPTPNIDALFYSGIAFTRHYANPACTPSRAAFMTGQYAIRSGLQGRPLAASTKDGLPTETRIMPQVLKDSGYRTHLVGKWHLGYNTWPHYPTRRGFDSFYGYLNGFLGYFDGVHRNGNLIGLDMRSNEDGVWPEVYGKYLPEVLKERAADVIKNHSRNHKDEPLFLLVAANAPHAGNRQFVLDIPPVNNNATDFIKDPERKNLADVMHYLDDTLGNITATLKSEGMLQDTMILFLSDNGGPTIDPAWGNNNAASNYPFRGTKMSMFEGGVRVPAVLWMAGLDPSAPRIFDNLFHLADWLPTFNAAAGGNKIGNLDGVDQWSVLKGLNTEAARAEILVEINDVDESWGYIKNDFKFLKSYDESNVLSFSSNFFSPALTPNPKGYPLTDLKNSSVAKALGITIEDSEVTKRWEKLTITSSCSAENQKLVSKQNCSSNGCLFDLSKDPSECFDVSEQYPDIKKQLEQKLNDYKEVMVKRRNVPGDNKPDSTNYFAVPSSSKGNLSSTSNLLGSSSMVSTNQDPVMTGSLAGSSGRTGSLAGSSGRTRTSLRVMGGTRVILKSVTTFSNHPVPVEQVCDCCFD